MPAYNDKVRCVFDKVLFSFDMTAAGGALWFFAVALLLRCCTCGVLDSTRCPLDCEVWFDGCEDCACARGKVGLCTFNPACRTPARPHCRRGASSTVATIARRRAAPTGAPISPPPAPDLARDAARSAAAGIDGAVGAAVAVARNAGAPAPPPRWKLAAEDCGDARQRAQLDRQMRGWTHAFEVCMLHAQRTSAHAVCHCVEAIDAQLGHHAACASAKRELSQISAHARGLCSRSRAQEPRPSHAPSPAPSPVSGAAVKQAELLRVAQQRQERYAMRARSPPAAAHPAARQSRTAPPRTALAASRTCPGDCVSWFDGCNRCACSGGVVGVCDFNPACMGAVAGTTAGRCLCKRGGACMSQVGAAKAAAHGHRTSAQPLSRANLLAMQSHSEAAYKAHVLEEQRRHPHEATSKHRARVRKRRAKAGAARDAAKKKAAAAKLAHLQAQLAHMKAAARGSPRRRPVLSAAPTRAPSTVVSRSTNIASEITQMQDSTSPAQLAARLKRLQAQLARTKATYAHSAPVPHLSYQAAMRATYRAQPRAAAPALPGHQSAAQLFKHLMSQMSAKQRREAAALRLAAAKSPRKTAVRCMVLLRAAGLRIDSAASGRFLLAVAAAIDAICGAAGSTEPAGECDRLARAKVRIDGTSPTRARPGAQSGFLQVRPVAFLCNHSSLPLLALT